MHGGSERERRRSAGKAAESVRRGGKSLREGKI